MRRTVSITARSECDRHEDRLVDARDRPVLVAQHMPETNQPVVLFVRGQSWAQRKDHDLLKSEVDEQAPFPIAEGKDIAIPYFRPTGQDESQVLPRGGLEAEPTLLRLPLTNGPLLPVVAPAPTARPEQPGRNPDGHSRDDG